MHGTSPLQQVPLFSLGPVPITETVVTTWGVMAVLTLVAWLGTRRLAVQPGPLQASLEILVTALSSQIAEITHRDARSFLPLIGTLFVFLATANLSAVLPGVAAPTAHIETPAALAMVVFFSVHGFGIRSHGLGGYLKRYLKPNPLLLPLNVLSELTRTFSLMVRLFGNIMSHEIVIAIVVLLAGFLVPVPFLLLAILIGLIQAYIFTVLAAVFIAAAVGNGES